MISATEITLAVPITFDLDALSEIRHSDDPPEKQYVVSATKQAIIGAIPNHIDAVKSKPFVREPTFDLHIRGNPINAQRITITVAPSTTLHELMMLLEDETGLSAKKQRLFLSGRLICDGNGDEARHLPVKHFGIANGFTIKLAERFAVRDTYNAKRKQQESTCEANLLEAC